jgi:hypothetical protein
MWDRINAGGDETEWILAELSEWLKVPIVYK